MLPEIGLLLLTNLKCWLMKQPKSVIGEAGKTHSGLQWDERLALLTLCAKMGFSREKPIELAAAQDIYPWVSHLGVSPLA